MVEPMKNESDGTGIAHNDTSDDILNIHPPSKRQKVETPAALLRDDSQQVQNDDEGKQSEFEESLVKNEHLQDFEGDEEANACLQVEEKLKCAICSTRLGRRSCTQKACIRCCTDLQCPGHREQRSKEAEKQSILDGSHPIMVLANEKRKLKIPPKRFKDTSFEYLGETILIWSLRDYLANEKWREDAIRRSKRNTEARETERLVHMKEFGGSGVPGTSTKKEGRRQRFQRVMEELYQKSSADADTGKTEGSC